MSRGAHDGVLVETLEAQLEEQLREQNLVDEVARRVGANRSCTYFPEKIIDGSPKASCDDDI